MKIEIRKSAFCAAVFALLFMSSSAGAVTVFVQYDFGTILSDPALVSASGSDFDVSADLQAGEFKGRAEGQDGSDQNAYASSLTRLEFTNNTGSQVVIQAGDLFANVQGDYIFGTGPNQSSQVSASLQVRIGATTYIAGSRHILASGSLITNPVNEFTKLFETNGATIDLTTASTTRLEMNLFMPELTLDPGATMLVDWGLLPLMNTDKVGSAAEVDFLTGANGLTLGLRLPAGFTLDSDSTVPLDWVTNVPVPGAIWLFGSGLVGLIGLARRKA